MSFTDWLKKDLHEATSTPTRQVLVWAVLMLIILVVAYVGNGSNQFG